ncbi:flagellar hook basal-body protein [Verrucomicrobia bacterium S94]|nr:flagellar hook basal-body protein [Verrucomicrobia bacterium S94]
MKGMNSGFYNAAVQMAMGSVQDMEIHTENLANSTMPGYKRLEASHPAFADVLDAEVGSVEDPAGSISINHNQGALRSTGRSLDFAIEGDGFFVVSDGSRDYLTRNGHFRISSDGAIVNSLGMAVQTTAGDFRIPHGVDAAQLEIDDGFNLRAGGKVIGTLKIEAVADPSALDQAGTTLFMNNGAERADIECKVLNGYLEQSNTTVFEEMVGMMTTMRNYEACQKMLQTVDDAEEKMMSKLV